MAHVVVLGAGIGGLPAAFDLKKSLGGDHRVTVVSAKENFEFVPSNPWIAVGWRTPDEVVVPLAPALGRRGIELIVKPAVRVHAADSEVELAHGNRIQYDYLVITTGPKLAFGDIPGLGPDGGHTESICTLTHAEQAYKRYQGFLDNPGPIVIGAVQGASCFGPAYEFAMIVDRDLKKRKLRHKVPMTFVTSEPYIGHLGLGGVGDSKGLLESSLRERDIKWISNARVTEVKDSSMHVVEHDRDGKATHEHDLPFRFGMLLPSFRGVDAVAAEDGLCNPKGFVMIDEHQRNPKYPNIYSAGVCVAIPPVENTPVPTGAPKTGYMIESMITAIVENVSAEIAGRSVEATATWNAVCLADMGNTGLAFVALPQIPPRNMTWTGSGYWVHLAKIAYEKYFLRKMRTGRTEPIYEKYVLKALGITRLAS